MAKRKSVQEILEEARRGGAAKPAGEEPTAAAPQEPAEPTGPPVEAEPAARTPAAPPVNVPTPQSLGRPLTLQEKLAAARAGASAAAAKPAPAPPAKEEGGAAEEPAKSVPPPAPSLGRPLTLQEKLAAARGGASTPAGGAAKPAAAAKPAPTAAKPVAAKRELPPLDKITDPKDLAEALRQAGAEKDQAVATAKAKPEPEAKPAKVKEAKPQTVLPRPSKVASLAVAGAATRRTLMSVTGLIIVGWAAFTLGLVQFTLMLVRFMFPNVLAEPPSSIKIGLPSDYEAEAVNERFKAEWGFWVVRSTRYNGQDILYALQSVCTHLGCPPNWLAGEQKFKCPCHGSGFYISGVNFEGPAPRPLERFKLSVADDGQLLVDKSQKFQEELGQWSDPDSFVSA